MTLFISGSEIFIIFFVILLLFGAKQIPDIARTIGKGMNEMRRATDDIRREFDNTQIRDEIDEIKQFPDEYFRNPDNRQDEGTSPDSPETKGKDENGDAKGRQA